MINSGLIGSYKIIRLMALALAEVIAVFEQDKPRIVSIDMLKEFRGENNVHGLPSDLPTPRFKEGMRLQKFLVWT